MLTKAAARGRLSDWPLAAKSILGFWLFYALTLVARAFLGSDPLTMLNNKMLIVLVGVGLRIEAALRAGVTVHADAHGQAEDTRP